MEQEHAVLTWTLGLPAVAYSLQATAADFRLLFAKFGPSLAMWRAAEVAVLRQQFYEPPILDLGCGDGYVTSLVLDRVDVGLDPDGQALHKAAALGLYRRLIPQPAEDCGLPAGCMGTVLSNSVLEHIAGVDEVLGATACLLHRGGRLIFTVPTEAFGPWLAVPSKRYAAWRNRRLIHRNLWSLEQWSAHLAAAGLEIETVRPYLRHEQVRAWDALDLLESVWLARHRLVGLLWRRLPRKTIDLLAHRAARLVFDAPDPGGGRLIVARKVDR